jgi:hypothetical protein
MASEAEGQTAASTGLKIALTAKDGVVMDAEARLAWARCVVGMEWNGRTCTGKPDRLDHAQALTIASARAHADGLPWRLPRTNELRHLVDRNARPPGPDLALFPAAPRDWHWAANVNAQPKAVNPYNYGNVMQGRTTDSAARAEFTLGWAVHLGTGEARGDASKSSTLPVRLVRSLPP